MFRTSTQKKTISTKKGKRLTPTEKDKMFGQQRKFDLEEKLKKKKKKIQPEPPVHIDDIMNVYKANFFIFFFILVTT